MLLESWELALRAERKSPATVKVYGDGARRFLAWAEAEHRTAVLDRPTVAAFVAAILDAGAQAATARSRHLALRRFCSWLVEEGELPADPLIGSRTVKLDTKVVPIVTDDELRARVKACAGPAMADRRDEAIVRVMLETGARAGESGRDTGRRRRPFPRPADRPPRKRRPGPDRPHRPADGPRRRPLPARPGRSHRLATGAALWLGDRGKAFSYDALHKTLGKRARQAGIVGFHPHVLRHTAASRWLAAGGSEGGLMAVAGWTHRDMMDRYTRATAADRAAAESRMLNLGDL